MRMMKEGGLDRLKLRELNRKIIGKGKQERRVV
jgi:hypothetical protein